MGRAMGSDIDKDFAIGDWLSARCGMLTASRMKDALDRLKSGQPSAKCRQYMVDLVAERMTGENVRHYVTSEMQWGLDHEDEACSAYEAKTGELTEKSWFIKHPTIEYFGATPDRTVGRDGLAEFKCPTTRTFIEWIAAGKVPEEHVPQMLVQLACTGRKWCDFVAFDPRIKKGPYIFIRRFTPTAEQIAEIEQKAAEFLDDVDRLFQQVTTSEP